MLLHPPRGSSRVVRRPLVAVAIAVIAGVGVAAAPASAALPDGRAFERVTPEDTGGVAAWVQTGGASLPIDDDTFLWNSGAQPATDTPTGIGMPTLARRTALGWVNEPTVTEPERPDAAYLAIDATNDATAVLFQSSHTVYLTNPPDGIGFTGIAHRGPDGVLRTIVRDGGGAQPPTYSTFANGMSEDGRTVVYTSDHSPPGLPDTEGVQHVYRWTPDGVTRLVPGAGDPLEGCSLDAGPDAPGASVGKRRPNGVSRDATRIFVVVTSGTGCAVGEIYRIGDGPSVPVSERSGTPSAGPATFVAATADGARAYVASPTDLAQDGSDANGGLDLYEWTAATSGSLAAWSCLTCDAGGITADQVARAFPSRSGDTLYFPASGIIGGEGVAGQERMFVRRGTTLRALPVSSPGSVVDLTPDGRTAVLQRAGTNALVRTRLGTDGAVTVDDVTGGRSARVGSAVWALSNTAPRGAGTLAGAGGLTLSSDGSTVVFTASAALAGGDPSGHEYFRWKDGDLAPLGDAYDGGLAPLVSPSGQTIFLYSHQQLTADARANHSTLFAARVGGGFPVAPVPESCAGEACRSGGGGAASPASVPATTGEAAVGNARPPAPVTRPRVTLESFGAGARRTLARSGRATVTVRPSVAGTIRLRATATVRGTRRVVASVDRKATRAGEPVELRVTLTRAARAELRRKRRLRVTVRVTLAGAKPVSQTMTLTMPKRG